MRRKLVYGCCFCGEGMTEIELALFVWPGGGEDDSGGQQYWVHRDCFVQNLTPQARTGPVGGSDENDEDWEPDDE